MGRTDAQEGPSIRSQLAVVCIVGSAAIGFGAVLMRSYPEAATHSNAAAPGLSEGARLPPLPGYAWNSHGETLVLALRVGCPYCEASMGFYEKLYGMEVRKEIETHVIAVFHEGAVDVKRDLPPSLHGLQVLSGADLKSLGVGATPTLLLLDSNGVARKIWRGQLSPEVETQVLYAVHAELPGLGS